MSTPTTTTQQRPSASRKRVAATVKADAAAESFAQEPADHRLARATYQDAALAVQILTQQASNGSRDALARLSILPHLIDHATASAVRQLIATGRTVEQIAAVLNMPPAEVARRYTV